MKLLKFKLFFTFGFFLVFLIFVLVINLPSSRIVSRTYIPLEDIGDREIFLSYPDKIWFGQNERIYIQIRLPGNVKETQTNRIQLNSEVIENDFEIDLVLNGTTIDPPGKLVAPLVPDQDLKITKTIKPLYPGEIIGSLWIHIRQSGQLDEDSIDRRLIYSKNIQIITKSIFGINFQFLRWSGLVGLIICLLFLFRYSKINNKFQKEQMKNL